MAISNRTLLKVAAWGGVIVASTGFYLQNRLLDKIKTFDYYKIALKTLRTHPGAVYYLGEPIKDKKIKITDTENNSYDGLTAKFCIPVSGSKENGMYYFWAMKNNDEWTIVKAELELKSKPDSRLIIVKESETI